MTKRWIKRQLSVPTNSIWRPSQRSTKTTSRYSSITTARWATRLATTQLSSKSNTRPQWWPSISSWCSARTSKSIPSPKTSIAAFWLNSSRRTQNAIRKWVLSSSLMSLGSLPRLAFLRAVLRKRIKADRKADFFGKKWSPCWNSASCRLSESLGRSSKSWIFSTDQDTRRMLS